MLRYRTAKILAIVVLLLLPALLVAQPTLPGGRSGTEQSVSKTLEQKTPNSDAIKDIAPLEAPVNPKTYRVGPNDQLLLSIPAMELQYSLTIGPDNSLVLPRDFPMLHVGGMTLEELRDTLQYIYQRRSSVNKNVAIALVRPRPIRVRVTGDVLLPGTYVLTGADRVTTAIDAANTIRTDLPSDQRSSLIENDLQRRSRGGSAGVQREIQLRWVTVRHNDGSAEDVDLLSYRALGSEKENPTLREGDEVVVRTASGSYGTVSALGAVRSTTWIPWRRGDNALLLYRLSGGSRPDAGTVSVSIQRPTSSGIKTIPLDINDEASMAAVGLEAGDQLVVQSSESAVTGASTLGAVSVSGEVSRPGTYSVIPGVTKLSEVIALAGGPTENASLNGAYIERRVDHSGDPLLSPKADPGSWMATSSLTLDDTTRLSRDLASQQGKVSADFASVIGRGDKSRDVALQNGDRIMIPPNPRVVEIFGRVNFPGAVDFVAGAGLLYYIDHAGGYTAAADANRVQMLRYGTGIWVSPEEAQILPGDRIYVPGERDTPARTGLEIAQTLIAITSGLLSIASTIFFFIRDLNK